MPHKISCLGLGILQKSSSFLTSLPWTHLLEVLSTHYTQAPGKQITACFRCNYFEFRGKKNVMVGLEKAKSLYCSRWSLTDSWWRSWDMPAPTSKGWFDVLGSSSSPTLLVKPLKYTLGLLKAAFCVKLLFRWHCTVIWFQQFSPHCTATLTLHYRSFFLL